MEIKCFTERKLMEIWLTRAESADAALTERLKPLYADMKACGYTAVVFRSGTEELSGITSALLCYNQRRAAELETGHGGVCAALR